MSTHGLQPGDALFSAAQKPAVVVQVDELAVESPTAEATEVLSRTVQVGKIASDGQNDSLEIFTIPVTRSRTNEMYTNTHSDLSTGSIQRSSSHETLWRRKDDEGLDSPRKRRALRMQLPSFKSLGIASLDSGYFGLRPHTRQEFSGPSIKPPVPTGRAAAQSLPLTNAENTRPLQHSFGSTPLLTPPEDADSIKWNNALLQSPAHPNGGESSRTTQHVIQVMASSSEEQHSQSEPPPTSQSRSQRDGQPEYRGEDGLQHNAQQDDGGTPLLRAVRPFISAVAGPEAHVENIHIIAQVLPQPAFDTTQSKPAFEEVVEALQARQDSDEVAYITLTHAVPPKFEMKDLPTSPPATPNPTHGRSDYFGQTIFTSAATVSTYHGHKSLLNNQAPPSPNTIVAPSSIHLSVLERYIPPTSGQEYGDFFDSRSHSILVDRLAELSVRAGRLLLLYPTKTGAETFMSSYLGPVMDPFLREFIFLNNLYFQLGTTLGNMSAVSSMLDFDDMESRLRGLCRAISKKASFRGGPSSTFTVIYSGKGWSTLDAKTWKEWYVNQELARIKGNLVDYHTSGGRMPQPVNHHELTTGMLARQLVDGIQGSTRVSGGMPIELGMFVIQRSKN